MKTVVITGCSAGVGRAAALLLDRTGWQVFAVVRKQEDAASLQADASGPLTTFLADVGHRDEVFAVAKEVDALCGDRGLDGLICNAGAGGGGPLEFMPIDELTTPIDTNLYGTLFCAQAFMPLLRRAHGRIINVTSGSTLFTIPLTSTYPAAKYAVELLTRQLRAEVAPFGVQVILVDPGRVNSRMTQSAVEQSRAVRAKLPPEAFTHYGHMLDRLDKVAASTQGSGKDPLEVAKVYQRALTDPEPKSFYAVGSDAKLMRLLARLLPQQALDALVARRMNA
jgi:NAD(P)-dependent dehydrogenase (short-subunit alcohol dehydrogenase family)